MRKNKIMAVVALLVCAVLLLCSCNIRVKDTKVDNARAVIEVNGEKLDKQSVTTAIYNMADQYGVSADYVTDRVLELLANDKVLQQKMSEYEIGELNEEQKARANAYAEVEFYKEAAEWYAENYFGTDINTAMSAFGVTSYKDFAMLFTGGEEVFEIDKSYYNYGENQVKLEMLQEKATQDVVLDEGDAQKLDDTYKAQLAADREAYTTADAVAQANNAQADNMILYYPEGLRYVKSMLVAISAEDESVVNEKSTALTAAANELSTAKNAVTQKQEAAVTEEMQAAIDAAKEALTAANESLEALKTENTEVSETLNGKQTAVSDAAAALEAANTAAQDAKAAADKTAEELNAASATAEEAYNTSKQAYDQAEGENTAAETALNAAKEAATEADSKLKAAAEAAEAAEKDAKAKAEEAANAEAALNAAAEAVKAAAGDYAKSKKETKGGDAGKLSALEAAKAAKAEAAEKVEAAKKAVEAADQAVAAAAAAVETAKGAAEAAAAAVTAQEEAAAKAAEAMTSAKAAMDEAKTAMDTAAAAVTAAAENAKPAAEDAQKAVEEAQAALNNAQAELDAYIAENKEAVDVIRNGEAVVAEKQAALDAANAKANEAKNAADVEAENAVVAEKQAAYDAAAEEYKAAVNTGFENAKKVADEIVAKVRAGESFDTFRTDAARNADTTMVSGKLADQGYMVCEGYSRFVADYVTAAMSMTTVGEVSEPVKYQSGANGWLIVSYAGDAPVGEIAYEDVKAQIEEIVLGEKKAEVYKTLADQWIKEAKIEYHKEVLED